MGVCCMKQQNQDRNELKNNTILIELHKENDYPQDKVIKIQSTIRMHRAKNKLKQMKIEHELIEKQVRPPTEGEKKISLQIDCEKPPQIEDLKEISPRTEDVPVLTSKNNKVVEVEQKLGPFKPEIQLDSMKKRINKGSVFLNNGAEYLGEWYLFYSYLFIGRRKQISEMDMECNYGLMVLNIKDTGAMIRQMGKGDLYMLMETCTKEIGLMTKLTARAYIFATA